MQPPPMNKIRLDLEILSKYEVVIFGSYIEGGFGPNSDIDIAILSRNKNREENNQLLDQLGGRFPNKYDINIFELLPIKVKYAILCNYRVLFGDKLEISEYLYNYRKIWEDCKHRIFENQFESIQERRDIFKTQHLL